MIEIGGKTDSCGFHVNDVELSTAAVMSGIITIWPLTLGGITALAMLAIADLTWIATIGSSFYVMMIARSGLQSKRVAENDVAYLTASSWWNDDDARPHERVTSFADIAMLRQTSGDIS